MRPLAKAGLIVLAFTTASALTIASSNVERIGPEQAEYGNLCGASHDDPCYEPVLNGGFPLAYLFDAPGISVQRQLAFVEDNLRVVPLALDIALYFAIVLLAMRVVSRLRPAR